MRTPTGGVDHKLRIQEGMQTRKYCRGCRNRNSQSAKVTLVTLLPAEGLMMVRLEQKQNKKWGTLETEMPQQPVVLHCATPSCMTTCRVLKRTYPTNLSGGRAVR